MAEVNNFYTVEKAAVEYLGTLYADKRALDEPAVHKFVTWIGRQKNTLDITTRDVDAFSKTALSGEGAALRRGRARHRRVFAEPGTSGDRRVIATRGRPAGIRGACLRRWNSS